MILLDWRTIGLDLVGLDMAGLDSVVSLLWIGLDRLVWSLLELQWLSPRQGELDILARNVLPGAPHQNLGVSKP